MMPEMSANESERSLKQIAYGFQIRCNWNVSSNSEFGLNSDRKLVLKHWQETTYKIEVSESVYAYGGDGHKTYSMASFPKSRND